MKKQNRISITVLMICFMVFAIIPSFLLIPSTIQTTTASDSTEFQEPEPKTSQFIPRTIRVAIYNEPNITMPSYGIGNCYNNLTDTLAALTSAGYEVTQLTTDDIYNHELKTADYDVFIMVDNLPRDNITNFVKEFWLGGGGLLSFDSAINFLCYFGIIPPESVGDNGVGTYWTYKFGDHEIYQRHPISKDYLTGDTFSSKESRGTFDWTALQGTSIASDIVRIATRILDPNDVTVLGFDPSKGGGRAIQMPWTDGEIPSNMTNLVIDAIDWLCPRPKGRILFDLSHMNAFGVDQWDNPYVGFSTRFSLMRDNLVNRSYTFDKLYPSALGNLTTNNLAPYDLLIINLPDTNFTALEVASVTNWISNGGGLLALGDEYTWDGSKNLNYLLSSTGLSIIDVGSHGTLTTSFEHPTEEGCTSLTMSTGDEVNNASNAFPLWGNSLTEICIAGEEYGNGRIILSGDILLSDDRIDLTDNLQFSINVVNWLTTSQAEVLIYVDGVSGSDPNDNLYKGPVATALNDLRIPFYLTFSISFFNLSLGAGMYKLAILENNNLGISTYFPDILNYMESGGMLIIRSFHMHSSPTDPLWQYLGYTPNGTRITTSPPEINIWNSTHRIFNNPAFYDSTTLSTSLNVFTTDFCYVDLHANATAIAGIGATIHNEKGAIILSNNGRAISNTMALTEYYDDIDDSTYPDALEIWENEIAFMMYQSLSVQINSPHTDDLFDATAPSFDIGFEGILLDDVWYTLNDGTEYHVASTTGAINQAAWDALPEGTVSLKFYVEDEIGQEKYQEVTILKDSLDPTITITNPIADQSFASTAPLFIVEIHDTHIDQMWYTLGSNTTKHFFTANGSIVQSAWDLLAQGTIPIIFYANDTIGNENSASVNVIKNLPSGGIPGYNSYIIVSLVGIISIIIIKRRSKK